MAELEVAELESIDFSSDSSFPLTALDRCRRTECCAVQVGRVGKQVGSSHSRICTAIIRLL